MDFLYVEYLFLIIVIVPYAFDNILAGFIGKEEASEAKLKES